MTRPSNIPRAALHRCFTLRLRERRRGGRAASEGPSRAVGRPSDLQVAVEYQLWIKKKPLKKSFSARNLILTYVFLLIKGRETAIQDFKTSH